MALPPPPNWSGAFDALIRAMTPKITAGIPANSPKQTRLSTPSVKLAVASPVLGRDAAGIAGGVGVSFMVLGSLDYSRKEQAREISLSENKKTGARFPALRFKK
jgi:hypothetical protein